MHRPMAIPLDPAAVEARLKEIDQRLNARSWRGFSEPWLIATCRTLLAELAARPIDDPAADMTDCAHPAWWRGNDAGAIGVTRKLRRAMDGDDDGAGVCGNAELERLRRDVLAARAAVAVAEAVDAEATGVATDYEIAVRRDVRRAALARYRAAKAPGQTTNEGANGKNKIG